MDKNNQTIIGIFVIIFGCMIKEYRSKIKALRYFGFSWAFLSVLSG
jgi:hypothetical protein